MPPSKNNYHAKLLILICYLKFSINRSGLQSANLNEGVIGKTHEVHFWSFELFEKLTLAVCL